MKIIIAKNMVPFIHGGAEKLADELCTTLREHGHAVALIEIPFNWSSPHDILQNLIATRLLKIGSSDKLIALKFPTYTIEHPHKVVWLLHQFRQAYELWTTSYNSLPNNAAGRAVRKAIHEVDRVTFSRVEKLFTISKTVSDRLKKNNGIASEVLYPPLTNANLYYCGTSEAYIYYPSRFTPAKRQHLVIEALARSRTSLKLVLTGNVDDVNYLANLRRQVEELGIGERVCLKEGSVSEEEKRKLFAHSVACIYPPFDEDYGYVTLEAMYSRKPVVTTTDSGEPAQFVGNCETGLVVEPNPDSLAAAIARLEADPIEAARFGENAYEHIMKLSISWDAVISKLLA